MPFFPFLYFKPLVAPYLNNYFATTFSHFLFCFFLNKQTSHFHTINIWTDIVRTVTIQKYTMVSHNWPQISYYNIN